ncbi:MAG: GxxExxY protein [Burkholderiales bacterium]
MDENECSNSIVGAAIEVHRHLGPGLLEGAYELALSHELGLRGLRFVRQTKLAAVYKGLELPESYRIDLMVEDLVIVEVKAVEKLLAIHEVQLLTYLRFANKRLGLLLNFHAAVMRDGVKRVVNNL